MVDSKLQFQYDGPSTFKIVAWTLPYLKSFVGINFREGRITNRKVETKKKLKLYCKSFVYNVINTKKYHTTKNFAWINYCEKSKNCEIAKINPREY